MRPHENQNKKCKNWRYVYHKFGITQRFSIEDTKERSQIRVMEVKKSYIWRDIMQAVPFLETNLCLYRFVLAFLPFIMDLIFGQILNIYENGHSSR